MIERATRIHAEAGGGTLAELQHIARELDIEPAALTRALKDVLEVPTPQRSTAPSRSWLAGLGELADGLPPRHGRLAVFAVLAASLGWLTAVATAALRESSRTTEQPAS